MKKTRIVKDKKQFIHLIIAAIIGAIVGATCTIMVTIFKEKVIDVPDYRMDAYICAPLSKVKAELVNIDTGKVIELPDGAQMPNPIYVRLKNAGKKPIENAEIVLEFQATGDFQLSGEGYKTKPEKGFGKIDIIGTKDRERRIRFALFNPGDQFEYFAMGTRPVTVVAYSKLKGLSFYQKQSPGCDFDI
jgi:hypothetical protein